MHHSLPTRRQNMALLLSLLMMVSVSLPACGKKGGDKPGEEAKKGDKSAANAEKSGEKQPAPTPEDDEPDDKVDEKAAAAGAGEKADDNGAADTADQRLVQRLKAAGVEHSVADDTEKRLKVFDAAVQPAIAKLHKFKFGKTSVQLSLASLKDPSKKNAVNGELGKLFGQLKAVKADYKRLFTRRSESDNEAALLIYQPADEALAKTVSTQLRIATRCAAAMASGGDKAKLADMLQAELSGRGVTVTRKDVSADAADLKAKQVIELSDGKGSAILVATYADGASAGGWATAKEARWQKLFAANAKLTNAMFAGLDSDTTKALITHVTDPDGTKFGDAANNLDLCLQKMSAK